MFSLIAFIAGMTDVTTLKMLINIERIKISFHCTVKKTGAYAMNGTLDTRSPVTNPHIIPIMSDVAHIINVSPNTI